MKKSVFAFIFIVLWSLCFKSFAGKDDIRLAAQKAARIALAAAMKLKNEETQGICRKAVLSLKKMCAEKPLEALTGGFSVVAGIFTMGSAWYALSNSKAGNKEVELEKAFMAARQELINLLNKNADGEIGVYGLPKICDVAVKKLIFLPGGKEELQNIVETFQKYFVAQKQEHKLSEQQSGARGSVLAKMIFWKKAAVGAK